VELFEPPTQRLSLDSKAHPEALVGVFSAGQVARSFFALGELAVGVVTVKSRYPSSA
jgi:hypothetical protein